MRPVVGVIVASGSGSRVTRTGSRSFCATRGALIPQAVAGDGWGWLLVAVTAAVGVGVYRVRTAWPVRREPLDTPAYALSTLEEK